MKDYLIIVTIILFTFVIFFIIERLEELKEKNKKKKIESKEIEVHRYYCEMVLANKTYEVYSYYSTLDFDDYVNIYILGNDSICVGDTILATNYIIEVNMIKKETVVINPIYNGSPYREYNRYYSEEEVKERMVG